MELCIEGSKGKNTQPLSISCPTVERVPDGQMGGYVTTGSTFQFDKSEEKAEMWFWFHYMWNYGSCILYKR